MDASSRQEPPSENAFEEHFGVAPDAVLNELCNIVHASNVVCVLAKRSSFQVHCAAADLIDHFEE